MNKIRNSSMFFLWAGAAISISEIYTGGMIAPLGIKKGLIAIFIGHVIGTMFLAFGGYISFKGLKNAMDKVRDSFGEIGAKIVAILNVLQLIGWSGIMIIQGARVINVQLNIPLTISIIIVGAAVFLWYFWFNNYTKKVNDISVIVLIVLCVLLFFKIHGAPVLQSTQEISFTMAVEMTIAMPVSWLPLIGDYSKDGTSGKGVFFSSFFGYFIGSVLMYVLGLFITVYTGKDVIAFLSSTGAAVSIIVILATVTTTFVDVYSSVISSKQIYNFKGENVVTFIYCIIATLLASVFPMEKYQNFLILIGSIFVPVYTIVTVDYISNKICKTKFNLFAGISALAGAVMYNYFTNKSFGIPTVFTFVVVSSLYYLLSYAYKNIQNKIIKLEE